ncbi:SdiA-regulated domain-containing protein [Mangrovivirga sp. M17]|uniref:SdiA-regulated domain-containing protein n=1 Tax=Mangrovivirga halotolerans TaxID=2993936 RepID=A0ABT3RRE9_9BACT|nr:SdiA-regulated domain-containing protein [Mangrovivirga halotolerans]MCX2743938.1 SdiA-regulated domain-containing protein [Mangrovivirga halotolerans]
MKYNQFIFFLGIILLSTTCSFNNDKNYTLPLGYSYNNSEKFILPGQLNEVSGILWYDKYIFICIQDEKGRLYKTNIRSKIIIETSDFKKNMDFEALAQLNNKYYCLESNGDIYIVSNAFSENITTEKIDFPFEGKNDFETLIPSLDDNSIYLLCKNCKGDNKDESRSFRLNLINHKITKSDNWKITKEKLYRKEKIRVSPSGAAINPLNNDIYIISHVGKWLAVFDKDENLKSFHNLDPKIFNQPEGITFNSKGDLYISNEARDGSPDIIELKYKSK